MISLPAIKMYLGNFLFSETESFSISLSIYIPPLLKFLSCPRFPSKLRLYYLRKFHPLSTPSILGYIFKYFVKVPRA